MKISIYPSTVVDRATAPDLEFGDAARVKQLLLSGAGIEVPDLKSVEAYFVIAHVALGSYPASAYLAHPFVARSLSLAVMPLVDAKRPVLSLLFTLAEPIECQRHDKTLADLLRGVALLFESGATDSSADSIFRAAAGAGIETYDGRLDSADVRRLIQLGSEERLRRPDAEGKAYKRSRVTLDPEALITLADGREAKLDDLPGRQRVYCPIHVGPRACATTILFKDGRRGVLCHHCERTFLAEWLRPGYDFDEFETVMRGLAASQDGKSGPLVTELRERFLPSSIVSEDGIWCIKSPKGSGKTEALKEIVQRARASSRHVLLIGHRTTLLQAMADRLDLVCYLESEDDVGATDPIEPPPARDAAV